MHATAPNPQCAIKIFSQSVYRHARVPDVPNAGIPSCRLGPAGVLFNSVLRSPKITACYVEERVLFDPHVLPQRVTPGNSPSREPADDAESNAV